MEPAPAGPEAAPGRHPADAGEVPGGAEEPDRIANPLELGPFHRSRRGPAGMNQLPAEPIECGIDGPVLHGPAGPRVTELSRPDTLRRVKRDIDRSDRIFLRSAAGARKARDGDGIIR